MVLVINSNTASVEEVKSSEVQMFRPKYVERKCQGFYFVYKKPPNFLNIYALSYKIFIRFIYFVFFVLF